MNPVIDQLVKVKSLLSLEKSEDLSDFRLKILKTPLHRRKEEGVTWYPVEPLRNYIGTGERIILEAERISGKGTPHLFQPGKTVRIFSNVPESGKGQSCRGIVNFVRDDLMSITLHDDDIPDWLGTGKTGIDLLFDEASYTAMENALNAVMEARSSRLAELRDVLLSGGAGLDDKIPVLMQNFLNSGQQEALKVALRARDVAFIHGPPGTGKTTTLVEIIRHVLQSESQILVCAPSNTAVDLLTEKIEAAGIQVVRIGHPARVTEKSLDKTLDARISAHEQFADLKSLRRKIEEIRRIATKYKRKFGNEEMEQRRRLLKEAQNLRKEADLLENYIIGNILDKTRVIASTLVGSASPVLSGKRFPVVFMDEASQALEPAAWIPLLKADKVIFAGDHWQLPPTIKSVKAMKEGLSVTLFGKGIGHNRTDHMLEIQYRMNVKIMGFSNRKFYGNRLKADPSVADRTIAPGDEPLVYYDTAGTGFAEDRDPESLSWMNRGEAGLLVKILYRYCADYQPWLESADIGIITPYRAQVELLNMILQENKPPLPGGKISVNTVDAFQGQERDVIMISLVRSNSKGEIGFLEDTRRMNVALTRARKKLIVLGDSSTIGNYPFYHDFLEYIDGIDAYRSAYEIEGWQDLVDL